MKQKSHLLSPGLNCKSPRLFALPVSAYSDEMEKEREKGLFLRTQKLEKKTKELREEMRVISERHLKNIDITRQIIERSKSFTHLIRTIRRGS